MKKLVIATSILALLTSTAGAVMPPPPPKPIPPVLKTSPIFGSGAAATTGFLGFVALLAGYDLLRRTTCIGDPLRLGGPGFSEPMPTTGNIMIPAYMRGKCK